MPKLLPKRRQRIPTIVPSYRPVLRRHQLIVESSGLLVSVVVLPVALLPLVVIMPPVKVVVHSVALLPLAAVVPRRRAARRRRVPPVAIVVPPIKVDCRVPVVGSCSSYHLSVSLCLQTKQTLTSFPSPSALSFSDSWWW